MSRTKKLATLIGAVLVIVLVVAPIAAAHHPAVTATMDCNGTVSYTVSAWETSNSSARSFTGVKVYSGSTLVGTGNFNSADNFSFTGSFTVASGVNSVVVTAKTDGTWGDGYTGVDQTSDTATRPTNCAKNPTISTVISPSSSIALGAAAHDTSSLTGAFNPTGTVSYKLYSDNHCGTLVADLTPHSNAVSSSTLPDSTAYTFNTAGTFYFVATYSGDSNNTGPVNSGCASEPLIVAPQHLTISTVISPSSSIALGAAAHDTSSLTGAFNPTGTVSYKLYSDNHCGTLVADLTPHSNAVSSSTLPDSKAYTFNTAGTFYFVATYSGDSNNTGPVNSGCASEPLIVAPQHLTISTLISPAGPIALGTQAHDTSSLTGAFNPTGTVSYKLYSDNHCGTLVADLTPHSNAVSSSTLPDSKAYTFNTAGTFYFVATYSGDSNNTGPVNSGCASEPLIVAPQHLTISTLISPAGPIALGTQAHDTSSLTGAFNPTGTVSYKLYSDNHCGTLVADLTPHSNAVSSSTLPDSTAYTFNTAGTFYFVATYSGDSNNTGPVNSGCASEPLIVAPQHLTISTLISPAGPIALGTQAHDTSTLTGAFNPTGTVSYKLYSDNNCGTLVADLTPSPNTVSSSTLPDSTAYTFNTAGTFYFVATYSGDSNNTGPVNSGCASEPLIVGPKTPTVATLISPAGPIALGTQAHDTSSLTGAFNPTGTVTYKLYSDNNCGTLVADLTPSPNTVSSSTLPDSKAYTFNTAGTFYFVATYSGDSNNTGPVNSGCTAEPLTVSKAPTSTVTAIKQSGSTVTVVQPGTSVTDVATVSGQVGSIAPTGTVSFLFYSTIDCSGNSTAAGSPALSSGTATSNAVGPLSAGSYSFKATYSGDTNYVSSIGACEPLTVPSPPPAPNSPAISITKNPKSQTIASGGTANFTITVTNTGNVTLTNVTVSDAQAPGCNASSSTIGALASMSPGASVTYNCALANVTASFTNSATATGTPPSGPNVSATDTAPVTVTPPPPPPAVTHPAITITKDPASQTIGIGGTASFTITVKNTGDVTLTNVTVSDPHSTDCNRSLGTLTVGQSKTYTCTRKNVNASFQNVADVTGKPPTGADVKASDHANIKVKAFVPPQAPRIAIVKSPKSQTLTTKLTTSKNANGATTTTVKYGTATFKIKVTNTGNVALHSVTVSDPQSVACDRSIGSLPVGAPRTYTCTRAAVSSNFTNVATVKGLSPKGTQVTATDHANVVVKVKTTHVGGANVTTGNKPGGPSTSGNGSPQFTG